MTYDWARKLIVEVTWSFLKNIPKGIIWACACYRSLSSTRMTERYLLAMRYFAGSITIQLGVDRLCSAFAGKQSSFLRNVGRIPLQASGLVIIGDRRLKCTSYTRWYVRSSGQGERPTKLTKPLWRLWNAWRNWT